MRLTAICLGYKRRAYKAITGNLTAGKYRIPYRFTGRHRQQYVEDLTQEAKNEMWLTRSYLNSRQESNLKVGFKKPFTGGRPILTHSTEDKEFQNEQYKMFMRPSVKFEDKWKHVKDYEPWVKREYVKSSRVYWRESEACVPRKLPDQWPLPVERWEAWNRIEGFGKNESQTTELTTKEKE